MPDYLADLPVSPLVKYAAQRAERQARLVQQEAENAIGALPSGKSVEYGVASTIDTKDVAVLIRRYLKVNYPGYRFKVRISRYAGGSSIYVYWSADFDADTPARNSLRDYLHGISSKSFDGMIDLSYTYDHWLHADGFTLTPAHTTGTRSYGGYTAEVDYPNPGGATLVSLDVGYVFGTREWEGAD